MMMKHVKLFEQYINEAYDGDLSDFEYDLMMAVDELGFSPKAIKKVTKKGNGYEVRMSSYMNQERNWQAIADEIGAELKSFKKDASINIGVFEAKNQAYESAQDQGLLDAIDKEMKHNEGRFKSESQLEILKVMKHIHTFENFLIESANSSKISEISDAIKNNLDPFDSIAGGECHDIALIAYTFAKNSDFLKNPVIKWTNGHAWVEGTFNQESVIFDIVAVNQKYLGEPFKEAKANANYPANAMKTNNVKKYLQANPLCGIDAESAEAGTEELEFLNDLL